MRVLNVFLATVFLSVSSVLMAQDWVWAPDFEIGDRLPEIAAPDQNGSVKTLADLTGEKGLVLVLSRSFDSLETLKAAEEDYEVSFAMLRDEDTKHVSALGILNTQYGPGHRAYGIPEPGIFLVSADGTIQFKFAEQDYRMRPDFSLVLEAAENL